MVNQYSMMQYIAAVFQQDDKVNLYRDTTSDKMYFQCEFDRLYVEANGSIQANFYIDEFGNTRVNSIQTFIEHMDHLDNETKVKYINYLDEIETDMIDKTLEWIG